MVWGGMSSHSVGRFHIVSGTVKAMDYIEILQNKLLPTARDFLGIQSWIFQDDNAPCIVQSVGREGTEDDQRPGRLVTVSGVETVTKINQIVRADRRMSIRMIVEAVHADKETVRKILHEELHMTKVCVKLVSKNLTPDENLLRQQVCSDFLERLKEDS
ncbi:putative mariner transposase [Trichonephila clavipes]|nr:putative mariner transposase [Trichonephila clavipes]